MQVYKISKHIKHLKSQVKGSFDTDLANFCVGSAFIHPIYFLSMSPNLSLISFQLLRVDYIA